MDLSKCDNGKYLDDPGYFKTGLNPCSFWGGYVPGFSRFRLQNEPNN